MSTDSYGALNFMFCLVGGGWWTPWASGEALRVLPTMVLYNRKFISTGMCTHLHAFAPADAYGYQLRTVSCVELKMMHSKIQSVFVCLCVCMWFSFQTFWAPILHSSRRGPRSDHGNSQDGGSHECIQCSSLHSRSATAFLNPSSANCRSNCEHRPRSQGLQKSQRSKFPLQNRDPGCCF